MISGGYGGGDIPVPIPNTAVKPTSADGTWGFLPGRVGRRRDFLKDPHLTVGVFRISIIISGIMPKGRLFRRAAISLIARADPAGFAQRRP